MDDADLDTMLAGSVAGFGIVLRSLAPALDRVTMPQYRVLVLTHQRGPMRSSDLAAELGVLPSGITRIVGRLVRDGYATRRPGQQSRREAVVEPTDEGRAIVTEVLSRRRREFGEVLASVTEDERAALVRAARLLADRSGPAADGSDAPWVDPGGRESRPPA